jgi:hypothetical protein
MNRHFETVNLSFVIVLAAGEPATDPVPRRNYAVRHAREDRTTQGVSHGIGGDLPPQFSEASIS